MWGKVGVARKIVITSGKGGVGKTTLTANLGAKLAALGERVVLVDIDMGLNNLDIVMGLENMVVYDIIDAIEGRCRVKQALVQDIYQKNLYVLASNHSSKDKYISPQSIKMVLDSLSAGFDFIIIDCPAGIDTGFHRAVASADEAIVVATPHLSSLRDADKVISVLASYKLKKVDLVVNRVRGDLVIGGEMLSPEEISAVLKTDLIGIVPEEDGILLSGGELMMAGDAEKSFKLIAQNVKKGTNRLFNVTYKYSGFLGSIRRSLKKTL